MIRVPLDFFRTMLRMHPAWWAWIAVLMIANGIVPLFFIPERVAWATLATFMVAAMLQMTLFARFGWVRLLGIGHGPWLLLLPWLWLRLDTLPAGTALRLWAVSVLALNSASLAIDIVDVVRYLRGERSPALTLFED
jgi:hypothetical protein